MMNMFKSLCLVLPMEIHLHAKGIGELWQSHRLEELTRSVRAKHWYKVPGSESWDEVPGSESWDEVPGKMAEWSIAPVWKTGSYSGTRVQIPLFPVIFHPL